MANLIRRNPSLGLPSLWDDFSLFDFDDLWNSFFRAPSSGLMNVARTNVYSDDNQTMKVDVEVPGYDREDIELRVDGNVLEISGERHEKEEHKDKKRTYAMRESSSSFARRIMLPEGADSERITAELDKGVLTVGIPVERRDMKRIEIAAPKSKAKRLEATTKDGK